MNLKKVIIDFKGINQFCGGKSNSIHIVRMLLASGSSNFKKSLFDNHNCIDPLHNGIVEQWPCSLRFGLDEVCSSRQWLGI